MYTLVWTVTYRQSADIAWKERKKNKRSNGLCFYFQVFVVVNLLNTKAKSLKKRIENKRMVEGFEGATHAQPIQLTILDSD